jgi:hypothetical protein
MALPLCRGTARRRWPCCSLGGCSVQSGMIMRRGGRWSTGSHQDYYSCSAPEHSKRRERRCLGGADQAASRNDGNLANIVALDELVLRYVDFNETVSLGDERSQ